jgi:hypothetical protein
MVKTERALSHNSFLSIATNLVKFFMETVTHKKVDSRLPDCYNRPVSELHISGCIADIITTPLP